MGLLSNNVDDPKNEFFAQALAIWSRWSDKAINDPKERDQEELTSLVKTLGTPSFPSI